MLVKEDWVNHSSFEKKGGGNAFNYNYNLFIRSMMIELEKMTLLSVLENSAEKYSHRPAFSFVDSEKISYKEFKSRVETVSGFLKGEGIIAGDKVAILSENQPNWGVAYFAITTIGAVAVPIMTEFHSTEVQHILRHSECKAVFISAKYFNKIDEANIDSLNI